MIDKTEPTNAEFRIALEAIRSMAVHLNLNINDLVIHTFILDQAEYRAQESAKLREAYNTIHRLTHE